MRIISQKISVGERRHDDGTVGFRLLCNSNGMIPSWNKDIVGGRTENVGRRCLHLPFRRNVLSRDHFHESRQSQVTDFRRVRPQSPMNNKMRVFVFFTRITGVPWYVRDADIRINPE